MREPQGAQSPSLAQIQARKNESFGMGGGIGVDVGDVNGPGANVSFVILIQGSESMWKRADIFLRDVTIRMFSIRICM